MSAQHKPPSNASILTFMVTLCFCCALVLSVMASALKERQESAKKLDQVKQMLITAKIFSPQGFFLVRDDAGEHVPATYSNGGILVAGTSDEKPSANQILKVYNKRIKPRLTDVEGKVTTFEEAGLNEDEYLETNAKKGYAALDYKLFYEVFPNTDDDAAAAESFVIPVHGFGLWDHIYGYLAIASDGKTVVGVSWYQQAETPGLGAEIALPAWQEQFSGKEIFLANPDGSVDLKRSPMGLKVVRGKVKDIYGDTPQSRSALDGMAGATLTGTGVSAAYKQSLTPYRKLMIRINEKFGSER